MQFERSLLNGHLVNVDRLRLIDSFGSKAEIVKCSSRCSFGRHCWHGGRLHHWYNRRHGRIIDTPQLSQQTYAFGDPLLGDWIIHMELCFQYLQRLIGLQERVLRFKYLACACFIRRLKECD